MVYKRLSRDCPPYMSQMLVRNADINERSSRHRELNLVCPTFKQESEGVDSIRYRSLDHLQDPKYEVLWAWLRPKRLLRGTPCVTTATIYHPFFNDSARDTALLDYLSASLTPVEGEFPGCGILLCGDFSRLKLNRLAAQFGLRQLVNKPTRGDQILDLVFTNQPDLYDINSVQIVPPFGLSDHNVVFVHPTVRAPREGPSRRTLSKRDTRASRTSELGRFLASIDWSVVNEASNCEAKLALFTDFIKIGLDHLMPVKHVRLHLSDPPWVTERFKSLIKHRQHAFYNGDMDQYRRYRNDVNRTRKSLRSKYYASKLGDIFDRLSDVELANAINLVFLEPMKHYQPLYAVPTVVEDSDMPLITEIDVLHALINLNPRKAAGPDDIGNWLLREYAVAEDLVVLRYVSPAVLQIIDPNQYGGIPRSSTLYALISMVHNWSQATDATGTAVRVVFFDYRKPFDIIDHNLLARKIKALDMPRWVRVWVLDFLSDRKQRVRLSSDCRSEGGSVPARVPQGTKLGPGLFLFMINDLEVDALTWKYVDDTTIAQTKPRGLTSDAQSAVSAIEAWSIDK
ncbi:uncharacterized protein LOC111343809 [Stylophora pistillata]|uniref:uncharacterized protein LOC111343809 n=1 Tax=Stylophora pistillata TaxID=50429 RepID=UPI000C04440C|nr:uncharacterized protein LOC111343809 [Stylophora pistillata]